eukprot:403354751
MCQLHNDKEIQKIGEKHLGPRQSNKFLDPYINHYAPTLKARLHEIYEKIKTSNLQFDDNRLEVILEFQQIFLSQNYREEYTKILDEIEPNIENYVICHNDIQECNLILETSQKCLDLEAVQLHLIDYEYAGWQPRFMDLANYINETVFDNGFPSGSGVGCFPDNLMTKDEIQLFVEYYVREELAIQQRQIDDNEFQNKVHEYYNKVVKCLKLNLFQWGVLALYILTEDEYLKPGIFNFDAANIRIQTFKQLQKTGIIENF